MRGTRWRTCARRSRATSSSTRCSGATRRPSTVPSAVRSRTRTAAATASAGRLFRDSTRAPNPGASSSVTRPVPTSKALKAPVSFLRKWNEMHDTYILFEYLAIHRANSSLRDVKKSISGSFSLAKLSLNKELAVALLLCVLKVVPLAYQSHARFTSPSFQLRFTGLLLVACSGPLIKKGRSSNSTSSNTFLITRNEFVWKFN